MTWPVGFLFTPQQLQGSMKYSSGVRLGNWREDDALDEHRLMDYVDAKEKGTLALTRKRVKEAPQIVPRTLSAVAADGSIRNGAMLQLTHLLSARAVAVSMGQQLKELDDRGVLHLVTATQDNVPTARNTLRVMSFSGGEGEPIVYGQDVAFICDAGGVGVLASARPATSHLSSQLVAKQDVFLMMVPEGTQPSYDCAWKIQPADVDLRLSVQEQTVHATDEVVLVHAFTNKRLAVTSTAVMSDMGMEAGMCCHTYSEPRKVNKLSRENSGFPNHNFGTRCETNEARRVYTPPSPPLATIPSSQSVPSALPVPAAECLWLHLRLIADPDETPQDGGVWCGVVPRVGHMR